jgi:hypothetical protein
VPGGQEVVFARLMKYYKGGLTLTNLEEMTFPEIMEYVDAANYLIEEEKRANR